MELHNSTQNNRLVAGLPTFPKTLAWDLVFGGVNHNFPSKQASFHGCSRVNVASMWTSASSVIVTLATWLSLPFQREIYKVWRETMWNGWNQWRLESPRSPREAGGPPRPKGRNMLLRLRLGMGGGQIQIRTDRLCLWFSEGCGCWKQFTARRVGGAALRF